MKDHYKSLALSGANLLALGISSGDAKKLVPQFVEASVANQAQAMSDSK